MGETTTRERLITEVELRGEKKVQQKQWSIGAGFRAMNAQIQRTKIFMDALSRSSTNFAMAGGMLAAAGGGVLYYMRNAIKAAAAQEAVENRLAQSMIASGINTQANADAIVRYASELQKLTGVGDEQIINAGAMLASFKMSEDEIRAYLPRILDMQQGLRKLGREEQSVEEIAIMLGKVHQGMIGSLRRVGVMVDENAYKTKGYKAIIEELDKEFGGRAVKAMGTAEGGMQAMNSAIGDLNESMGMGLLPIIRAVAPPLTVAVRGFTAFNKATRGLPGILVGVSGGLVALAGTVGVATWSVRTLRDAWAGVAEAAMLAKHAQIQAGTAGAAAGATAAGATAAGGGVGVLGRVLGWAGVGAAGKVGRFGRFAKGIGPALLAGIAGGFISDWGAGGINQAVTKGDTGSKLRTVVGGVGGGALQGAGIGAAIGSIVPGLGTAIGAAAGAVIGAGVGAFSTNKAVKEAQGQAEAQVKNPQLEQSNRYLSDIVKLLDKSDKAQIIGGGSRAMSALNQGDIQRAMVAALNSRVV